MICTGLRIFLGCIFLLRFIPLFSQSDLSRIKTAFFDASSSQVLVAAHRAAHLHFPENSLAAIQAAIDLGVDLVEIDVRLTKDMIPVLMHDGNLDRTSNGTGKISDYTWEQLQQYFLEINDSLTHHKIPTLKEALSLTKGRIMVDLDLKVDRMDEIIQVVREVGVKDEVIFFDSNYFTLLYIRKNDSTFHPMPRAYSLEQSQKAIDTFHPPIVHIDPNFYNEEVVRMLKMNRSRIWINALGIVDMALFSGKTELMDQLLSKGANVIQTDQPQLLLSYLKAKGLHW